jgi:PAS domain S-box-containing protein
LRKNKAGEAIPVRLTMTPVNDDRGQVIGIALTTHDMTELKQAEARLRRMTKVFMDSATPMSILDLQGRVVDANPASEQVFGWTREERLGQHPKSVLEPEWHDVVDAAIEQSLSGQPVHNLEIDAETKDGRQVSLLVTTSPLADENDEPLGIAVVTKDITDLRRTTNELDRTARQLQRSNRELREFAFAMTHDLQEPLRSIIGFGKLLQQNAGDELDGDSREFLDLMTDAADHLRTLINDLLAYASLTRTAKEMTLTDSAEICDRAIDHLHSAIEASGATVTRDGLPTVPADASQLTLLLQNLIGNAIKYRSDEAPDIRVSAERRDDSWQFAVRDNGIGIKPQDAEQIFEVFRRLHSRDEFPGTGIGLATCKKIVERHGGDIWVESAPGEGSTFCFTIPYGDVD